MIIVEFLLGAAICVFIAGWCGLHLIRDTIRWEEGTRLGTMAMWVAVALAAYVAYATLIQFRFFDPCSHYSAFSKAEVNCLAKHSQ